MSEKQDDQIAAIEATQAALRKSIEATKRFAEKAEHLLQQHKQTIRHEGSSPQPQHISGN